jgi:hypothetical protein
MDDNNTFKSYFFKGLASVAIIGGLYWLFRYTKDDSEDNDSDSDNEQKKKENKEGDDTQNTSQAIDKDLAIRIMAEINKKAEDIIKKVKPDIDHRRREAINDKDEYEKICSELFEAKESALQTANKMILGKYEVDNEELNNELSKLHSYEIENGSYGYDTPHFDGPYPDKKKVKEIYIEYGEQLSKQMNNFQKDMNNFIYDETMQDYLIYRILVLKLKTEDKIYLKYRIAENQLKYLIFHYELLNDSDVSLVNEKINRLGESVSYSN